MGVITSTRQIGFVAVDSGQLLITDPGYVNGWGEEGFGEAPAGHYSYGGACETTLSADSAGQLNFPAGHGGMGVVSSTGFGDGLYPVYATYVDDEDGSWGRRIARLEIVFIDDDEPEDDE